MSITTSRLAEAATAVRRHPTVQSVRVTEDRNGTRTLEAVLVAGMDRVPPGVLSRLGEYDCGIASVQPQGSQLVVELA
ncbi:hypothetical protein [Natronobacterium gregoryi]|uniref:hypothetical protein n=1 Tax=Natronobacterium gregoryi TaxID=44930 RepID=UPI001E50B793|nr:hypothetical protein [Natronobacterium gregoryi]